MKSILYTNIAAVIDGSVCLHDLCELGKLIRRHSNQTNLGVKAHNYILSA